MSVIIAVYCSRLVQMPLLWTIASQSLFKRRSHSQFSPKIQDVPTALCVLEHAKGDFMEVLVTGLDPLLLIDALKRDLHLVRSVWVTATYHSEVFNRKRYPELSLSRKFGASTVLSTDKVLSAVSIVSAHVTHRQYWLHNACVWKSIFYCLIDHKWSQRAVSVNSEFTNW